jgi:hypothetical protein
VTIIKMIVIFKIDYRKNILDLITSHCLTINK